MTRIKVDIDRAVGEIDPRLFGHFVEHVGRCIYGGVFDEGSPLADSRGFRKDVLEAVRALGVPILRWPGGNFVSGYHWTDGVGRRDGRPKKMDVAWRAADTNRFGTDEFMTYCAEIGAQPYICINTGTGTMEEAQNWVEYCNGSRDTHYANMRRANGRQEPYGVKYWGLGNEVYGWWQIGHRSAEDYGKFALECAKVMKWVDPSIELVACGAGDPAWDRVVLEHLIDRADYISIHMYVRPEGNDKYYSLLANSERVDSSIEVLEGVIAAAAAKAKRSRPLYIAFDEWNVWYRERENGLEERYDLTDALMVASFLNSFLRHADTVKIANLAQMVNVIAPIVTSPTDTFLQTIYHPVKLYRDLNAGRALDVYVDCDAFSTDEYPRVPYLDVSASFGPQDGNLTVNVVNRHRTEAIEAEITSQEATLDDVLVVHEVNGAHPRVCNSFDQKDAVKVTKQKKAVALLDSRRFTYRFPSHSITSLQMHVR